MTAPSLTPPTTPRAPAAAGAPRERLLALDVFRGATVAGMLLVNNPGSWAHIHPPLAHAAWHGWTPTDLIFPFFLFIVGITTHLSLAARADRGAPDAEVTRGVLRRGALIILFGLALAAFPFWPLTRLTEIRIPGVLQRIGVAYVCAALLTRKAGTTRTVAILAGLLLGYWVVMTVIPIPGQGIGALFLDDPTRTMVAYVDRLLLDGHLWRAAKVWDPEGPLSTIPAVGTAILGVLCGRWIGRRDLPLADRLNGMFAVGAVLMVAGLMWHWVFPINKGLWTSSYVLFTGGMAAVALATILWVTDVQNVTWWTRPFVIYGVNPIVAFVGSGMMARVIYSLWKVPDGGKQVAVQGWVYQHLYAPWLEPRNASLAFAVSFVLLWYAILAALYRRNIILKV